jgi:hypothetical protein
MVTQQNIPHIVNGDQVIMFTNKKTVSSINGVQDLPSLYSWYKEDPNKHHLGLMNLWGKQAVRSYGILRELLQNKAVLEVNGWDGGFTYDIPVEEYKGCYTTRDLSNQTYAGIDGGTFKIVLSKAFTTGDVLTNDKYYGQQIVVSGEEPVVAVGEGWEHTVKLADNDKTTWFLPSNLVKGTQYFKVGHVILGERGTNFSHFDMPDTVGTMRCEFRLGTASGVEAYITGMADSKSFSGADAQSKQYLDKLQSEFGDNEYAVLANMVNKGGKKVPDMRTARIGATMEFLTMRELERLTAQKMLFQKAATIRDTNGMARLNEGLWHQLRRGKLIKYGRPGGITRDHLKEAVEYVFRINPFKQDVERRLKFKAGKYAYQNMLEIFSDEVNSQNAGINNFLGTDRTIPNPVRGNDPFNLEYVPIRFTKVFIPGIGNLEVEEDTSLNMMEGVDRLAGGMHPENLSPTAYSLIIWDVEDQQYSNNKALPKGATLIEGGNAGANIYLVKPEGEMSYWGTTNGRYDYRKAGDIMSSMKQIGQEFWAFNIVDIHVKDLTRFVMVELDEAGRKGFN